MESIIQARDMADYDLMPQDRRKTYRYGRMDVVQELSLSQLSRKSSFRRRVQHLAPHIRVIRNICAEAPLTLLFT